MLNYSVDLHENRYLSDVCHANKDLKKKEEKCICGLAVAISLSCKRNDIQYQNGKSQTMYEKIVPVKRHSLIAITIRVDNNPVVNCKLAFSALEM